MVKHTQIIRQQFADELFECVWPFCEIGAKGVNTNQKAKNHLGPNFGVFQAHLS